ncbi:MAG: transposase [Paludibacteraceae bacterium]
MQEIAKKQGLLSVCIGGLKSAVTNYAHTNKINFAWQTRFHDHIIRDTNEMNRIADYIENNVTNWALDCFYDSNPL